MGSAAPFNALWLVGAIVLALPVLGAGAWLLRWGLRDRGRGRRRCPKCWYDMSGIAGLRCPECGHEVAQERQLHRRHIRWVPTGLGLLLVLAPVFAVLGPVGYRLGWHYAFLPKWRVTKRIDLGVAIVEVQEVRNPRAKDFRRRVVVTRDGERMLVLEGFYFELGGATTAMATDPTRIGLGEDITGDGLPDLIVQAPTGGSGGATTTSLFSIDTNPWFRGVTPEAVIPWSGLFEPPRPDQPLRFRCGDPTFDYVWTAGYQNPRIQVPLIFRPGPTGSSGAFVPDLPSMRRPGATEQELDDILAKAGPQPRDRFAAVLRHALELIYAGHADAGFALLDREQSTIEAATQQDHETFLGRFRLILNNSPFRDAVRAVNAGQESLAEGSP
ncbi:MAG: hypothetical protein KDA22_11125 [Phycisphaerales bacterium]|nr:hypothetical protein [Phycisphaerales bacterium]